MLVCVCICKIYLLNSEIKVCVTMIFVMQKYMSISKKGCKETIFAEAPILTLLSSAFEQCFSFLH